MGETRSVNSGITGKFGAQSHGAPLSIMGNSNKKVFETIGTYHDC